MSDCLEKKSNILVPKLLLGNPLGRQALLGSESGKL
jgi:hypothetical protein